MAEIHIRPGTIRLVKMTDDEYFAEKGYISNSKLGLINPDEDGSFEKFESQIKSEYSESFALGSAIHASVLQPDYFTIPNIDKPSGKLGLFAEEMYKLRSRGLPIHKAIPLASERADYYAGKLKDKRLKTALQSSIPFYLQRMKYETEYGVEPIFISAAMRVKYDKCMINIKNDPEIMEMLSPEGLLRPAEFYNEYVIFCEVDYIDTETGECTIIKIKGKLDNFTINHETETLTLNDLKTTGKPVEYFMGNHVEVFNQETKQKETVWYNGSFQHYRYYRQMGIYIWLLLAAAKEIHGLSYKPKCNMLVVETIPEFNCKVYPVNGRQINFGLEEFKKLLTLVVEWMKTK
jgi:hypothetical protein